MPYTMKTTQEKLFELAWQMEQNGNGGWYTGATIIYAGYEHACRSLYYCDAIDFPIQMREGIFYYSSGHGWRVRKNPHWFEVFKKRFPETVKYWQELGVK